jgi:hypothetical protein
MTVTVWTNLAAWVEAVGTICAVVGAAWVASGEARAAKAREERARQEALLKEERALISTKTAALNLAILAATQIHKLHILLRNDDWRARVGRVSASRALLSTEHMLAGFPIQSLADAEAMVEFSSFPAGLEVAAEVYANLEHAVRAAADPDRSAIFVEYTAQMGRLDRMTKRHLKRLKKALGLDGAIEAAAASTAKAEASHTKDDVGL